MNQNIGSLDRLIRVLLGAVILGAGVFYQSLWGIAGLIPLVTGIAGICPFYYLFEINTNTMNKTPSI